MERRGIAMKIIMFLKFPLDLLGITFGVCFKRDMTLVNRSEEWQGEWNKRKHYSVPQEFDWATQLVRCQRVELETRVRILILANIFLYKFWTIEGQIVLLNL